MKISEGISILNAEKLFGRTPIGRPITEYAIEAIEATLSDEKNSSNPLIRCLGCGFVISSLLTSDGCPNCGVIDLTLNVNNTAR